MITDNEDDELTLLAYHNIFDTGFIRKNTSRYTTILDFIKGFDKDAQSIFDIENFEPCEFDAYMSTKTHHRFKTWGEMLDAAVKEYAR